MKLLKIIINKLQKANIEKIYIDDNTRMKLHREAISRKVILRNVFKEFCDKVICLDDKYSKSKIGKSLELGAGVYPIKNSYPHVLATDIVENPIFDSVVDAQNMVNIEDKTLHALYGQNCFHHFADPEKFFQEARRVLNVGGVVIFIEPYYGPFATLIFKNLFSCEDFNKNGGWKISKKDGVDYPNQALSYIVFVRDKKIFEEKFNDLEIVHQEVLPNYIRYLLSGGLNFHSLVPNFMNYPLKLVEFIMMPLARIFGLFHIIVLRKK